jgi:hypothetical protein
MANAAIHQSAPPELPELPEDFWDEVELVTALKAEGCNDARLARTSARPRMMR